MGENQEDQAAELWFLGGGDGKTPESRHVFRMIRTMNSADHARVLAAQSLIARLVGSDMSKLDQAADRLYASVRETLIALSTGDAAFDSRQSGTVRAFGDFLGAFRSFSDRTAVWLSREFGKKSPETKAFLETLRGEYERNAAYRVLYDVRNMNTHIDDVVNSFNFGLEGLPDGGTSTWLSFAIDGPKLVERIGPKMKAEIRDELAGCPDPIHLVTAVEQARRSCLRAQAALAGAVEPRFSDGIELLIRLNEEALAGWDGLRRTSDRGAVTATRTQPPIDGVHNASFSPILVYNLAELQEAPAKFARILTNTYESVPLRMLCTDPDFRIDTDSQGAVIRP